MKIFRGLKYIAYLFVFFAQPALASGCKTVPHPAPNHVYHICQHDTQQEAYEQCIAFGQSRGYNQIYCGGGVDYYGAGWFTNASPFTYAIFYHCPAGRIGSLNPESFSCIDVIDIESPPPNNCSNPGFGKPIYPTLGVEKYTQSLGLRIAGQLIDVTYNSVHSPWGKPYAPLHGAPSIHGQLGNLWWLNLDRRLVLSAHSRSLQAVRDQGKIISFSAPSSGGSWKAKSDQHDNLDLILGGNYIYRDLNSKTLEIYTSSGILQQIVRSDGMNLTTTQNITSSGNLSSLKDPFGREIKIEYKNLVNANIVIDKVIDPASNRIVASYDNTGNLTSLTWQDNTISTFLYESPNAGQEWALSGIIGENNKHKAKITYDQAGWAKSSEGALGTSKYVINYTKPPEAILREVYDSEAQVLYRYHEWVSPSGTTITQPTGAAMSLSTTNVQGMPRAAGYSQPSGSGCSASTNQLLYDSRGNIERHDTFNNTRICYSHQNIRNLEASRVEGLIGGDSGTSCSSALSVADVSTLTPEARKTSTEWHPDWKLETRRAEPKKLTTWVYNGQPDPFNG
ncbi:MAG: RHS repeat protein, partial [Sphingobacteriales bacterium]